MGERTRGASSGVRGRGFQAGAAWASPGVDRARYFSHAPSSRRLPTSSPSFKGVLASFQEMS